MDLVRELAIVLGRIVTIIPLLLIITLMMGRRSIGELPVFDFLVILILGAVVGADIADPKIEHIHTAVAIILIGALQFLISMWAITHRKFGRLITFEPTIVIKDGQLLRENIKRIRYSLDNVLQMLRENDTFDVSEVQLGIIESNGRLTVYKQPNKGAVTAEDLGIKKTAESISYPVIIEGKIYTEVLKDLKLNETWLRKELAKKEVSNIEQIFYASVNKNKKLHISFHNQIHSVKPDIFH
ncbi:DUF421 domain-containing protein [Priestia filamentosa]|uniref:DUF421 domain-containing protein n=1 Tax=Priestia filamentosa TaxID=1402861 RepID=UPI003F141574